MSLFVILKARNPMPARYLFAMPGLAALVLLCLGPLMSGRLIAPYWGIATFLVGGALGAVSGVLLAVLGVIGEVRRTQWARAALAGAIMPLASGFFVALLFVLRPGPADRFNDVTTDIANPPAIVAGPNAGMQFPPQFERPHRSAYPDLTAQAFEADVAKVFAAVLAAAREKPDWQILHRDDRTGDIQFLARTGLFRFEDDLVVRVRASANRSVIDMRSRSRIGTGDRGTNAARIVDLQARVESYLRGHPTMALK
jgi:uncharacterized protein (DUF1499 family)